MTSLMSLRRTGFSCCCIDTDGFVLLLVAVLQGDFFHLAFLLRLFSSFRMWCLSSIKFNGWSFAHHCRMFRLHVAPFLLSLPGLVFLLLSLSLSLPGKPVLLSQLLDPRLKDTELLLLGRWQLSYLGWVGDGQESK